MHHSMLAEALAQRHPHGERIHVHRETSKRRVSVEPGEVHARVHDYLSQSVSQPASQSVSKSVRVSVEPGEVHARVHDYLSQSVSQPASQSVSKSVRVSVEPGEVHARVHDYLVAETTGVLQLDLRALEQCKGADLVVHLSVKRDVKERCCS